MEALSYRSSPIREPHVVILGGAYAGMSTALNLLRICNGATPTYARQRGPGRGGRHGSVPVIVARAVEDLHRVRRAVQFVPRITIIDARDGYYHSVGTPLAHTSRDYIPKPWKTFGEFAELKRDNVSIIQGRVAETNLIAKTVSYTSASRHDSSALKVLPFDYLVIATGLRRPWPTVPSAFDKRQYEKDAENYISALENSHHGVIVFGGGAVGIEMAAEIKHQHPPSTSHSCTRKSNFFRPSN